MINNTFSSSEQYTTSSIILNLRSTDEVEAQYLSVEESSQAFGMLNSIEFHKKQIQDDLSPYYHIDTQGKEMKFLIDNPNIAQILPSLAKYIKNNLDVSVNLELELLSESSDWQTLFINACTNKDWESSNLFMDSFLENLYELYPEIAQQLNLNIVPDEF